MEAKLEDKIKAVESAIQRLNTIEECDKITKYGERVLECVRSGDYREAGFVFECSKSAMMMSPPKIAYKKHEKEYSEEVRKNFMDYLGEYLDATKGLIYALPQNEIAHGMREFHSD